MQMLGQLASELGVRYKPPSTQPLSRFKGVFRDDTHHEDGVERATQLPWRRNADRQYSIMTFADGCNHKSATGTSNQRYGAPVKI